MTIAIMSAMQEEIIAIVEAMDIDSESVVGSRTYYRGQLHGCDVVVVFSHWGKVAAAITTTTLITTFNVSQIIFTGVAGAISDGLNIGDIVIGHDFYQHDMDASPIIEQHEIPLLGRAEIRTTDSIREKLESAANEFLANDMYELIDAQARSSFNLYNSKIVVTDIASGDQFVSDSSLSAAIALRLPSVQCVEMEGASVAQVCDSFDIPFGVVRTISDSANEASEIDFQAFIGSVAQVYSLGIIKRYLTA